MASVREWVSKSGETKWQVLYRQGKKQSSKTFETPKAAEKFRALVDSIGPEEALKYLKPQVAVRGGMTVDELAEKWLADKRGKVTPDTYVSYQRDYDTWIKKKLGHREAAKLTEVDVQEWVDWMRSTRSKRTGELLDPKSIGDRHAILHQMYKWGSSKTRALVPGNPCKETELPRRRKKEPKGLRIPELQALIAVTTTPVAEGDALALRRQADLRDTIDFTAFIAGTGFRIGEALALPRWAVEEVYDQGGDFVGMWVTMVQVHRQRVGVVRDAKSAASLGRRLRVLGPGAAALRRRIVGLAPNDLVFTFADGRPGVNRRQPWNANSYRRRLTAACEKAGLGDRGVTPHWLRHTHVALCHAAGMSIVEIQRRLGHEDIQTTVNVYGGMIEEMSDELAARADALFVARPQVVEGAVVGELA